MYAARALHTHTKRMPLHVCLWQGMLQQPKLITKLLTLGITL